MFCMRSGIVLVAVPNNFNGRRDTGCAAACDSSAVFKVWSEACHALSGGAWVLCRAFCKLCPDYQCPSEIREAVS